MMLKQLGDWFE